MFYFKRPEGRGRILIAVILLAAFFLSLIPANLVMAEPELKKLTATIQYQFADGRAAAEPYIATVKENWGKTVTVPSPEIEGYTSNPNEVVLVFDESFTKDQTYTVIYSGNEVDYTVVHKFQSLDNPEEYLEDESKKQTLKAQVGEEVSSAPLAAEGFTPVRIPTQVVPADQPLEMEVLYDRLSYQLSFDSNGGTPVEAQHLYFEANIIEPENPVRKGYKFDGWEPALPENMPANNLTVKAKWRSEDEATYLVKYWAQDPDMPENYTYVGLKSGSGKVGETPSILGREGLTFPDVGDYEDWFEYFYEFNSIKTEEKNKDLKISADGSTELNVYYDRKAYKIAFYPMGYSYEFTTAPEYWTPLGSNVIKVDDKEYRDDTPKGDLSNKIVEPYIVNVLFGENLNGSDKWIFSIDYFPEMKNPDGSSDFVFSGWLYNSVDDDYFFYDTVFGKFGVSEVFRAIIQYNHKIFYTNGDKPDTLKLWPYFDEFIEVNSPGHQLTTTSQINMYYYFQGFDELQEPEDFPEDISLHYVDRTNMDEEYLYTAPQFKGFTPIQAQFSIVNFKPETIGENPEYPTGDIHVRYYRNKYKLNFYEEETSIEAINSVDVFFERPLVEVIDSAFKPQKPADALPEYVFQGWATRDGILLPDDAIMPAEELDLVALWGPEKDKLTVTFYPKNGQNEWTEEVNFNTPVTRPQDPIKPGFTFLGWQVKTKTRALPALYNFSNPVRQDLELEAVWRENKLTQVTVKYVYEGDDGATHEEIIDNVGVGASYTAKAEESKVAGYFPDKVTQTLDKVAADPKDNVITFTYTKTGEAEYSVFYEDTDGNELKPAKTGVKTKKAIETEDYIPIEGYTPHEYQITFMLTSVPEQNKVTFIYRKNGDAFYKVEYHFADGKGGYLLDESMTQTLAAPVGSTAKADPAKTYKQYVLNTAKSELEGIVTSDDKLVLRAFYDLKPEPTKPTDPPKKDKEIEFVPWRGVYRAPSREMVQRVDAVKTPQQMARTVTSIPATGESSHLQQIGLVFLMLASVIAIVKKKFG